MRGRPPTGAGTTVVTNRTRSRRPRALAEAEAARTMLETTAVASTADEPRPGARVFTLYGHPPGDATETTTTKGGDSVALSFYRRTDR